MSSDFSVVKDLLQTLTDGIEGFTRASESVKDSNLKMLFAGFAAERQEMADELTAFSDADGTEQKTTITGAIHRGWINLRSVLTSGDDHAILAECERGEDHALAVFKKAADADLPADTKSTIASIATRILTVHNQVKELRDQQK
ncbi:MAG TPA: PA2169 family four-helix-bundle protein [Chthoniobacterales bacterium]|nr:PA2169 family four-helix-bundle protein [Chthoniobacterales bacterium]